MRGIPLYKERGGNGIEPIRYFSGRNGCAYLKAYCHLREEVRTFRTDRIHSWTEVEEGHSAYQPQPRNPAPVPVQTSARTTSSVSTISWENRTPLQPVQAHMNSPAASAAKSRPRCLRVLFIVALLFVGGKWLFQGGSLADVLESIFASGQYRENKFAYTVPQTIDPLPNKRKEQKQGKASETVPRPAVIHLTYRGTAITGILEYGSYNYKTQEYGLSLSSLRSLHLEINSVLFRRATGIQSENLEALYAGADTDRDGYLTWREIQGFQRLLLRRYNYRNNATALRPDDFIALGGGDCEDWALVTCGLLRYWGWTGYVGAFYPPMGGNGHAVCLVRWAEKPGGLGTTT